MKRMYLLSQKQRYISEIPFKGGKSLLMTPKPPFGNYSSVEDYLSYLSSKGVNTIVVLLHAHESSNIIQKYKSKGFKVIEFPITDFSIPEDMKTFSRLLRVIRRNLKNSSIAIHCLGGNGRTGTVVAGMFIQMGMEARKAINFVRKYRPEAIETFTQEKFLHDFEFFERFIQ